MDYSYLNVSLWNIIIQLGILAAALLFSTFLGRKISVVRNLMMPPAVLAGFLLLILKTLNILPLDGEFLESLVYHSIAIGFIAMSLRIPNHSENDSGKLVGVKSGAVIVSSYLIQGVVGLLITLALAYTLMPDLFKAAGILLPMGYGQGPGQANNIGSSYEALGFAGGRSFGLAIAAAGYLCACIVGVIMLNILAKKGKISRARTDNTDDHMTASDFQDQGEIPVSESIDRFSVQFALVLITYLATYLVTWAITATLDAKAPGIGKTVNSLLWGFNFIIGSAFAILVRVVLKALRRGKLMTRQYQNNYLLNRISGLFFDLMIVAGIAAIDFEDLAGLWLPFLLMAVAGGIVTWFHLALVCKKVYPDYYYEGLMSMYGMMTGTISSGVLLLREIDPNYQTPAANNLVIGSSFAIIFGFPVLLLVGIAPNSTAMTFVVLGLCALYYALLLLFIFKAKKKTKTEKSSSEEKQQ